MSNRSLSAMDRPIALPVWRRRPFKLGIAALMAMILIGILLILRPASGSISVSADSLDFAVVRRAPFQDFLALRGEAVAAESILVTSAVSGRVERIYASDGEAVAKDGKLAVLANPDFVADLTARRAELSVRLSDANSLLINLNRLQSEREAQVDEAAYALHKTELELERKEQLHRDGIVNDAFVRPFSSEVVYRRERLAQARQAQSNERSVFIGQRRQIEASAQDLRHTLDDLAHSLDNLTVAAPASGRLSGFTLRPGQAVKQGDSLGEVDVDGAFKLKAQVDEFFAARLMPGLPAVAQTGDRSVPLTLGKIYRQVTDGRITVDLQFDGKSPSLQPGQTVDVRLSLGGAVEALVVPNGPWLRETGGHAIFVVGRDGKTADRREISVGRHNPDFVEILGGLAEGDRVVTSTRLDNTGANHLLLERGARK